MGRGCPVIHTGEIPGQSGTSQGYRPGVPGRGNGTSKSQYQSTYKQQLTFYTIKSVHEERKYPCVLWSCHEKTVEVESDAEKTIIVFCVLSRLEWAVGVAVVLNGWLIWAERTMWETGQSFHIKEIPAGSASLSHTAGLVHSGRQWWDCRVDCQYPTPAGIRYWWGTWLDLSRFKLSLQVVFLLCLLRLLAHCVFWSHR